MPATGSNSPADLEDDYMDDMYDYDAAIPDIDTTIKAPALEDSKKDTLGIDEEVKIKKKRIVVKLDEARLLSSLGIPKLRQEAPTKLRFKGKGHEYRDTARLLSYYQFWADDLYKKAKFRDTLKIIEKLGHSKGMREQRLSWIEETKRRDKRSRAGSPGGKAPEAETTGTKTEPQKGERALGEDQDDDDLYSLPQQRTANAEAQGGATGEAHASSSGALFLPRGVDDASDDDDDFGAGPNDDELDALMEAERTVNTSIGPVATQEKSVHTNDLVVPVAPQTDDFEDEMEAMADFGAPDW